MKIEIEIDDAFLQRRAKEAIKQHIGISSDPYGRSSYTSDFARFIEGAMAESIRDALKQIDFLPMIDAAVATLTKPTIEEAIAAELRAMAKKEVKAALKERTA